MNTIRNGLLLGAAFAVCCAAGAAADRSAGAREAQPGAAALSAEEREALQAAAAPALNEMRAGAPNQSALKQEEREELAASQAANPELQNQRAGLSDSELALVIVASVLGFLLLVILIAIIV
jgi:hypothetical protein